MESGESTDGIASIEQLGWVKFRFGSELRDDYDLHGAHQGGQDIPQDETLEDIPRYGTRDTAQTVHVEPTVIATVQI